MAEPTNASLKWPVEGTGAPVPPIPIADGSAVATSYRQGPRVSVSNSVLEQIRDVCASVSTDPSETTEASRDWWPLAMVWATEGKVAERAEVIARPSSSQEVADVLAVCDRNRIPVTTAAGRSGVTGASVPVYGGVILDMCGITGIRDVDDSSLTVDVAAGTFGDRYENELRESFGLTGGHWPQSMALSTVGGWLACRGAGQMSTRYGKIEDIVSGLDVVLADGRSITTGGHPREAVGPDLTQLFVGSEGTLGVITGARLRVHPLPSHEVRGSWSFDSFDAGAEWIRRVLRRGATPAVLRLYDPVEAERHYHLGDSRSVAVVLDEGDAAIIDAAFAVVTEEAETAGAVRLDDGLVDEWLRERNNVAALKSLISKGFVVDTMEITTSWARLPAVYRQTVDAISAIPGVLAASSHLSHSYTDGACLYFTFAGQPVDGDATGLYRQMWEAGTLTVLRNGGSLSHHHGVGLNRSRFVANALGGGLDVIAAVKSTLDPNGILNPGKLGLDSSFGPIGIF